MKSQLFRFDRWAPNEFELFFDVVNDETTFNALRYDGFPNFRLSAWKHFCLMLGHWETRNFGEYKVSISDTNEVVGICGIAQFEGLDDVEITWAIHPRFRRLGYASSAVNFLAQTALAKFPDKNVIATISIDNEPSKQVARNCGFKYNGPRTAHGRNLEEWLILTQASQTSKG